MPRGKWQLKDGLNGRIFFPLTATRIERWIEEGRVHEDDRVWRTGFSKWKRVREIDRFKPHLGEQGAGHRRKKTREG